MHEVEQLRAENAILRAELAQANALATKQAAIIRDLQEAVIKAESTNQKFAKMLFGKSSEKTTRQPQEKAGTDKPGAGTDGDNAGEAPNAATSADAQAGQAGTVPTKTKKTHPNRHKHGRSRLPDWLERVYVDVEVPPEERICPVTQQPRNCFDYEETEQLAYQPGRVYVIVTRRPKLVSPLRHNGRTGVYVPPLPEQPFWKYMAHTTLVAAVIVAKFADHLPIYRQEMIFAREQMRIPDSTINGWIMSIGEDIVDRIEAAFKKALFEDTYLAGDDTTALMLGGDVGGAILARLWIWLRYRPLPPGRELAPALPDGQRHTVRPQLVAFQFTEDRSKEGPLAYLEGWENGEVFQGDACDSYNAVCKKLGLDRAGCWAHGRRGFTDAEPTRPQESGKMIRLISELYKIEKEVRGASAQIRLEARQERAVPVLDKIFTYCRELLQATTPSDPLAKACNYLLNQESKLRFYTLDGRVEIDNNIPENWIRPLVVGRANWLFMGSKKGGRINAMFMSLVQSCRCNDINPWQYLCDLFNKLMDPKADVRFLLPDAYAAAKMANST